MRARTLRVASRIGLVALVGAVAVIFLSSSWLSAIVGSITVGAVLLDVLTKPRDEVPASGPTSRTISVDLKRRS